MHYGQMHSVEVRCARHCTPSRHESTDNQPISCDSIAKWNLDEIESPSKLSRDSLILIVRQFLISNILKRELHHIVGAVNKEKS